jgi:uncharacterized protein
MKKLIIASGTGYLGKVLVKKFEAEYDEIVILTRGASRIHGKIKLVHWDAKTAGAWQNELENAVAVINLAGKNVNCRYTEKNKAEIFSSRLDSTDILGNTMQQLKNPPQVWINAASATIYRDSVHTPMTESKGEVGEGFSVEVCKAWEKIFNSFPLPATRKVCLRIGMVLGNGGGVFPVLKRMTRLGLGGKMGSGKQMVSWIDEEDFANMIAWSIHNPIASGVFNCTSPAPLTNSEFSKLLRKKLKIAVGIPSPAWLLAFGAFFIRTEPELVLKSRFVVPERAQREGFVFTHPEFQDCLEHLLPYTKK